MSVKSRLEKLESKEKKLTIDDYVILSAEAFETKLNAMSDSQRKSNTLLRFLDSLEDD